jgi:hypothetical protein
MQDKKKKTKKQIKIHDLKPSKDAKGGVATNVSIGHSVNRGVTQSVQRPGNPNS